MEKTIKVTNKQQINCMVDLMEKNPDIARGKRHTGSSRQDVKEIWEEFGHELNSLGPPFRTAPEWQRVWIHYKANLKRKLARNGSGPLEEICLTGPEERVYELTHANAALDEDNDTNEDSLLTPITIKPPVVEASTFATRNKRLKTGEAKIVLLRKQIQTQNEILRTLRKLEETKYNELILKKRKLEIIESREERESVLRELKIKIAEAKLQQFNQVYVKSE